MATWVIGDVQGCFVTLQRLLERLGWRPGGDRLWLAGDLVNRGRGSLETLRWAVDNDRSVTAVLGNHDIHLLARAADLVRPKARDTLDAILAAPDRDRLVGWLRERPLLHRQGETLMVHAGLLPEWTRDRACSLAREVEALLREPHGAFLLELFKARATGAWDESLGGIGRQAAIIGAMTRLRTLSPGGAPCAGFSGPPGDAPPGCVPWFSHPARRSQGGMIVFGHWAALGLHRGPDVTGLDTGCVWGGSLTAWRLEDGAVEQVPAAPEDLSDAHGAEGE